MALHSSRLLPVTAVGQKSQVGWPVLTAAVQGPPPRTHVCGRIEFLTVLGLKLCFLAIRQPGVTLHSSAPASVLAEVGFLSLAVRRITTNTLVTASLGVWRDVF